MFKEISYFEILTDVNELRCLKHVLIILARVCLFLFTGTENLAERTFMKVYI